MAANGTDLLNALALHETKVSELYQAFAQALPEWNSFWLVLVKEEHMHALWLHSLKEKLEKQEGILNECQFNPLVVQTSMTYLQRMIDEVKTQGIKPMRALALSLDLEGALLEKNFFQVYESDSVHVQQVFSRLREQTLEHRQRIQVKLDEERAKCK